MYHAFRARGLVLHTEASEWSTDLQYDTVPTRLLSYVSCHSQHEPQDGAVVSLMVLHQTRDG